MRKVDNIRFFISIALFFAFSFIFLILNNTDTKYLLANTISAKEADDTKKDSAIVLANPFSEINLSANSALVYVPAKDQVLFDKNSKKQLALASLTKLVTAVVALETLKEDELIPFAGDLFYRDDLVSYMLVVSSNEAADAIANYINNKYGNFYKKAKDIINKIGLKQTYILNPSGLDISDYQSGGYGSAYDVAKLIYYIHKHYQHILDKTTDSSISITGLNSLNISGKNTNKIIGNLAGFIGGKTGYTDISGGNLAVIVEPGGFGPVVIVVLGAKDKTERFVDVKNIYEKLMEYISYM